jgi:hypothetical protein
MPAWQTVPDARWENARHFISGERDVSEWIFTGTSAGPQAALCSDRGLSL